MPRVSQKDKGIMKGKYLYAIAKTPRMVTRQRPRLLRGGGIATVDFRRLSAVVAKAEYKDYHSLAKEEAIKELTSHQQMIEKIMENFGSILPVKFGTILKDEEEVSSALEKGYSFLKEALRKMEAKIEFDLVCFWNEQKAAQLVFQKSKRVQTLQKNLSKKRKVSLEEKIALGKVIAKHLETQKEKISNQILRALKRVAVENCPHVLADVNMLLNQAFLVEKENEESFNHVLNQLDSKLKELVNFRLVGPLPPYSFATVVIELLDKEEVEKAKKLLKFNGEINKENLKKAYDKLAFELHPDYGGNPIEFELVTQGYKLLRKYVEHGLVNLYLYQWKEQGEL